MKRGFSIIEIIITTAMFVIFATGGVVSVIQSFQANRLGAEKTIATHFATEGIEAVRSIKNQGFANLVNSNGTGVVRSASNVWAFGGVNNTMVHNATNNYIRVLRILDVYRDGGGNIVSTGGTLDPDTKKITSRVTWNFITARPQSVELTTYMTKWKAPIGGGGMLVYGDGSTSSDAIRYNVFMGDSNSWGSVLSAADVDTGSTNRALRSVRLYTSPISNSRVMVSRHYNGLTQYIYAQVYNGSTWGNVVLLASWGSTSFLNVQNFDGTFLSDGTFLVVYSDNSIIPKSRIWNGTSWLSQTSLTSLGASQIPNYIVTKRRPGTNEIMAAFFTQGSDSITQYFNGSSWSAITTHTTTAPSNTRQYIDFDWSPNVPTTGAIVYPTSSSSRTISTRIFEANGAGSGTWGTAVATTLQASYPGVVTIVSRGGANEFQMCDKDTNATPRILCYRVTFAGTVASVSNPTNQIIAPATDTGIQRSYHLSFEQTSQDLLLGVYSDNTNIPKYKRFTPATNAWDGSATSIPTSPYTLGTVRSVRLVPKNAVSSNDILVVLADNNRDLYTVFWNGETNGMYSAAGRAFTRHGINGSATTDLWYDFSWDTQ